MYNFDFDPIIVKLFCFSISLILLLIAFFYFLYKQSRKMYDALDDLKLRSQKVNTKQEAEDLWNEFLKLNKESWHKAFLPKLSEIKGILETKYKDCP